MTTNFKVLIILITMFITNYSFATTNLSLINQERKNDSDAWNYYGQDLTSEMRSRFVNFSHPVSDHERNAEYQLLLLCDTTSNKMALNLVTNSGKLIPVAKLALKSILSFRDPWKELAITDKVTFQEFLVFFQSQNNNDIERFLITADGKTYETSHTMVLGDFDMHKSSCRDHVFSTFRH